MSKPTSTTEGQAAPAELKQCVSCFELKPISEFRRRSGRRAGANARRGICRQCRAAAQPPAEPGETRGFEAAGAAPEAAVPAGGFAEGAAPGGKRGRRRRGLPAAAPEAALDEAAALAAPPEEMPRPARKRRRRRGGQPAAAAADAPNPPEPAAPPAEEPAAPAAAGAPKRKRRGRRKRGSASAASVPSAAEQAAPAEVPAAPAVAGAPKRKRRGRRKARGGGEAAAAQQQAREAAALPAAPAPQARAAVPQPQAAAKPPAKASPAPPAGEAASRVQPRGSARARATAPGGSARGIDPHDASLLRATREGFVRMRGRTDKGRGWYQEIDLEMAVTLVREHAAVVVNRHTIRRLLSNRDFRLMILNRDKYTCYFCGEYGDTIDHLLPRSKGGHTTPDNCVCACNLCNQTKANRDLDEFVAAGIPVKPQE